MDDSLKAKVRLPLFVCRLSLVLVYLTWTYDKFFNAKHGASIMNRHYGLDFVTAPMVFGLGFLELIFVLAILFGFHKRITRGLLVIFSAISVFGPKVMNGYLRYLDPDATIVEKGSQIFHPHFLLPAFCMLVCSIIIYAMRDYDTLYSL